MNKIRCDVLFKTRCFMHRVKFIITPSPLANERHVLCVAGASQSVIKNTLFLLQTDWLSLRKEIHRKLNITEVFNATVSASSGSISGARNTFDWHLVLSGGWFQCCTYLTLQYMPVSFMHQCCPLHICQFSSFQPLIERVSQQKCLLELYRSIHV